MAGCGSGKTSAPTSTTTAVATTPATATVALSPYVREMRTIGGTLGRTVDQLYPIDSGTAGSQMARDSAARLERARKVVAGVQSRLATLQPPAKIAADHRDLQKAVGALIAQMDKLAAAIRTGDGDTFNQLSQLPAVRGVSAATDAMVKAGYDVVGP